MIDQVRRFNRTVTQRVGALEDAFLSRDRPLGQARVLWEIGPDGRDVRELRARLDLDSGYLSRLLRSLESDGLVVVEPNGADGRVRTARLTDRRAGRASRAGPARRRGGRVDPADPLGPPAAGPAGRRDGRGRAAADGLERPGRRARPAAPGRPACHPGLRHRAGRPLRQGGFDPARSISATDDEMTPPAGLFLVATLHGEPVGCGALKFHRGAPGGDQADVGRAGGRAGWGSAAGCWPSSRRGPRRTVPGRPAGDQPHPGRGDQPVPDGRLPRGGGVQRRAVRPPLVREGTQRLSRPSGRSKTIRSARRRTRRRS